MPGGFGIGFNKFVIIFLSSCFVSLWKERQQTWFLFSYSWHICHWQRRNKTMDVTYRLQLEDLTVCQTGG